MCRGDLVGSMVASKTEILGPISAVSKLFLENLSFQNCLLSAYS